MFEKEWHGQGHHSHRAPCRGHAPSESQCEQEPAMSSMVDAFGSAGDWNSARLGLATGLSRRFGWNGCGSRTAGTRQRLRSTRSRSQDSTRCPSTTPRRPVRRTPSGACRNHRPAVRAVLVGDRVGGTKHRRLQDAMRAACSPEPCRSNEGNSARKGPNCSMAPLRPVRSYRSAIVSGRVE